MIAWLDFGSVLHAVIKSTLAAAFMSVRVETVTSLYESSTVHVTGEVHTDPIPMLSGV